jgi:hypothetical protein
VAQEHLVGQPARIGMRLEDVRQPLRLEPFELARIQARLAHHLRQQLDSLGGVLREGLERGARRVPAGLAAHLDAEPLGRLGEGRGIQPPGAGHLELRRQGGHAGPRLVLGRRPGVDQQMHVDDRGARHVHRPDGEPVGELAAGELGEVIRPRSAGRGSQGVERRWHQAASSLSAGASAGR